MQAQVLLCNVGNVHYCKSILLLYSINRSLIFLKNPKFLSTRLRCLKGVSMLCTANVSHPGASNIFAGEYCAACLWVLIMLNWQPQPKRRIACIFYVLRSSPTLQVTSHSYNAAFCPGLLPRQVHELEASKHDLKLTNNVESSVSLAYMPVVHTWAENTHFWSTIVDRTSLFKGSIYLQSLTWEPTASRLKINTQNLNLGI